MQLMILAVVVALPLILHTSFGHLRRMQVWGPWALRDFACFLPSGALLRVVALYDSRGSAARSSIFAAALLLSIVIDTMRHVAILSAAMTVLGSRWNALKGCLPIAECYRSGNGYVALVHALHRYAGGAVL